VKGSRDCQVAHWKDHKRQCRAHEVKFDGSVPKKHRGAIVNQLAGLSTSANELFSSNVAPLLSWSVENGT
jgi:hypothetical protein